MADIYLDIIANAKSFQDAQMKIKEQSTQMSKNVQEANQKMQTGFDKTTATLKTLATQLGITFGAIQVLNYLKGMVNETIKFEKSLAQVYTQLTAIEKKQFKEPLRKGALEVMAKYGLTMDEVTNSMFEALSAGIKVGEVLEFVDEAARLAVGGVAELDIVTDAATSVMNAYGYSVSELTKISNAFFISQLYGKTTVGELAQEIGTILPVARAAGVGYQELLAAFGLLTKQGINTSETATALRATLVALARPTREAELTFKNLGIETGLVALKQNGLGKTLLQVALASEDNADVLTTLIPNVRALSAVAALGTNALIEYERILKEINEDTGEGSKLTQAYEEIAGTTEQTFKRLSAAIKAAWIESKTLNDTKNALRIAANFLANDLNKDDGLIKSYLKLQKILYYITAGQTQGLIAAYKAIFNSQEELTEQTINYKDAFDKETKTYIQRIKAAQEKLDSDKKEIETITTLKLKITELQKERDALSTTDKKGIETINLEILAIQKQIRALEGLGTAVEKVKEVKFPEPAERIDDDLTALGIPDLENAEYLLKQFTDEQLKIQEDATDADLDLEDKKKEAKKQALYEIGNTAIMLTELSMAKSQNAMDQELAALEEKHKKELISDETYEKQSEQIRRKYARDQQQIAVKQALIDGALAIVKTFVSAGGFNPVAVGLAALMAIQTSLQVSIIKAQKFAKGVIDLKGKGSGTSDEIPAWLSRGESVMTAKETKEYLPYLKAMKEGTFPRFDLEIARKFEKNTYNNLNYDNSKEIKELRTIAGLLKNRNPEVEFIQNGQRVIKKGNVTTRINLN